MTPTPNQQRHLMVGATAVVLMVVMLVLTGLTPEGWVDNNRVKSESWTWRISVSFADTSVALLVATLLTGPLRVLRGATPSVHQPIRRVLGVWAGAFALAHVAFSVFVHTSGLALWGNWLRISPFAIITGKRGFANWLGLGQVALIVLLLYLSRDAALRRFGATRWKRLQRSSYLLFAMVVAHALAYQAVEQRIDRHRLPLLAAFGIAIVVQFGGFAMVVLRRRRTTPMTDAGH